MPAAREVAPFLSAETVKSRRADELRDAVQQLTVVHEVEARRGSPDGLVARTHVGALNLVFVRYGAQVIVDAFPTHNRFTLTDPLGRRFVCPHGPLNGHHPPAGFEFPERLADNLPQHTLMEPDPMAGGLVVSTSLARLEEELSGLSGRSPGRALRFLPPDAGPTVAPHELLESSWRLVCQTLSGAGGMPLSPLLARRSRTSCSRGSCSPCRTRARRSC